MQGLAPGGTAVLYLAVDMACGAAHSRRRRAPAQRPRNASPDSARAALDALAAIEGGPRIAVLGEMPELGEEGGAEHRVVGEYAASRAEVMVAVDEGARLMADGAGERAVADNDAAVDRLRVRHAAGDAVLVKASRGVRLDEVAAALA
ncbi:glutamate ligase domain-containing protein [Streptomyces sp. NPDC102467]|uniref:glutamate ligase domain-containing protein n=1 Tax=Streptomyces sp. NPDC102467 TaxID=3366179 RepID=UPI0037F10736